MFFGAYGKGVIPVPFPNTEVKSLCAYGTARETAVGESDSAGNLIKYTPNTILLKPLGCRGGEIGRRAGFKIQWGQPRAGSIPALGTN